jgi:transposase
VGLLDRGAPQHRDDVAHPGPARSAAEKKSLIATERDEAARTAWRNEATDLDPAQVVFLDETSTHTSLTRRYARAPRGMRAYGHVPRNHGHNVTLLAALTPDGIGPSMTIAGSIDSAAFTAYVRRFLVPSLRPGQVVILDNLSAHKSAAARAAIEAAGCELRFLPAYSPDFNPIELAFAKIKSRLRAAAARDPASLEQATAQAINRITPADARAYYAHCGFLLRRN